jgi:TRAP-type C4-dicarboxylate transport system substrate-binding protein
MLPHPPTRAPAVRSAPQRRLRWVLAHEPPVVFEDASEHFVHRVREKTDGELGVELFLGPEYSQARGEYVSRTELVRCVQRGEIEMAHCYVAALGAFHDPLWAVELPFLFRDYDHAERVFEGPAGRALMDGLLPKGIGRCTPWRTSGGCACAPRETPCPRPCTRPSAPGRWAPPWTLSPP